MLVIADSSPLIVLAKIDFLGILPALFGEIVIPTVVAAELRDPGPMQVVRTFAVAFPSWLKITDPKTMLTFPGLHPGETAALSLAIELHAELVLVDDRRAYHQAVQQRLNAIGTVRILERAAEQGLLNLADAFGRLKQTDFWISHDFLDERLRLFHERMDK